MRKKHLKVLGGLALFLGFAVLLRPGVSQKPACHTLAIESTKFCFPHNYFGGSPPEEIKEGMAGTYAWLHIPVRDLPISPNKSSYETVSIQLTAEFNTFANRMAQTIEIFETVQRLDTEESGMTVLTKKPENISFWSDDILYPENDDSVYFTCARPWVTRWGKQVEVGCQAHLNWDPALTSPRVSLSFAMPRKDLLRWKEFEIQVRQFLARHMVKSVETKRD